MAQRDEKGRFVRIKPDYKAMCEEMQARYEDLTTTKNYWRDLCNEDKRKYLDLQEDYQKRINFLLNHAPFWVKWLYKRHFKKG